MAAAVQRKAIEGELQRFTLRVTRRTVPIMFSMMFVQASERRSSAGNPSRLTVRISSNPSRILFETPGASRSKRWAEMIPNAVRIAELAIDKQAQTLLMPVSARRQLNDLPDDLWTKISIEFYKDGADAVFKALME